MHGSLPEGHAWRAKQGSRRRLSVSFARCSQLPSGAQRAFVNDRSAYNAEGLITAAMSGEPAARSADVAPGSPEVEQPSCRSYVTSHSTHGVQQS